MLLQAASRYNSLLLITNMAVVRTCEAEAILTALNNMY